MFKPKTLSDTYKTKPYDLLGSDKNRAIFILHKANFTYSQIQKLMIASPNYISLVIKAGYALGY